MSSFGNGRSVCNFCGEEISIDATRCPYCGSILSRGSLLNNELRSEGVEGDDSSNRNSDPHSSKGLFDNSINADISAKDFINEEKVNEKIDNLLDDALKGGSFNERAGLFDDNNDDIIEESIETEPEIDDQPNFYTQPNVDSQPDTEDITRSSSQMPQDFLSMHRAAPNNPKPQHVPPVRRTPNSTGYDKPSLSNAMKVFLTSLSALVPGLGQLVGAIIAIVYMNSEGDADKRSFGVALLVNSIIIFVLWAILCCVLGIIGSLT